MSKVVFKLSKDHLRQMGHSNQEEQKLTEHQVRVKLTDIEMNQIKDNNNPRSHEEKQMRGPVVNAIKETLEQAPKNFTSLNRGLLLIADSVSVTDKGNHLLVSVDMPEDENEGYNPAKHGCADGGTTMRCCERLQSDAKIAAFIKDATFQRSQLLEHQKEFARVGIHKTLDSDDQSFSDEQLKVVASCIKVSDLPEDYIKAFNLDQVLVPITIYSGKLSAEFVADLCEARNTSKQVKSISLINYAGGFDFYKDAVKEEKYADNIRWDEFGPEEIPGEDCICIMDGFRKDFINEEDPKHPSKSFASQNSVIKQYGARKRVPSAQEDAKLLAPIIPDINRLHDLIMGDGAYQIKNRSDCRAVECRQTKLPFLQETSKIFLHKAFRYPLLFAFRSLVGFDPTTKLAYWKTNPFEFWEANKKTLVATALKILNDDHGGDPGGFGKAQNVYSRLMDKAENLYLRGLKEAV